MNDVLTGAVLIEAERRRQVMREGYSDEHDNNHTENELLQAAQCYVWAARQLSIPLASERMPLSEVLQVHRDLGSDDWRVPLWPWEFTTWKPESDPVRCLVKAGALIAAEIDRLNRMRARP
jgi:hypothetical protein